MRHTSSGLACLILTVSLSHTVMTRGENLGLEGNYLPASQELDIRGPTPNGLAPLAPDPNQEPPYTNDNQINCSGSIPPEWYVAYPDWIDVDKKHWLLSKEINDKREGAAALKIAINDVHLSPRDIYVGTKIKATVGAQTTVSFDMKLSDMSYRVMYAVRPDGRLSGAAMLDIEDYEGHPRPETVRVQPNSIFGDGQWHTYSKTVIPTADEISLIIAMRANGGLSTPPPPLPNVGEYNLIDNVRVTALPPPCPLIYGDIDRDNDVDQEDFGRFQACLTGPGTSTLGTGCKCFDHAEIGAPDGDQDIDAADWVLFQRCMSGANVPADPNCDK